VPNDAMMLNEFLKEHRKVEEFNEDKARRAPRFLAEPSCWGLSFMLPLLWRYWAQVTGEQGWLCTKFRLLFPLSNVVFRHVWYARY